MAGNRSTKKVSTKKPTRNTPSKLEVVVRNEQETLDLKEIKLPKELRDDPRKASFFVYFFDPQSSTYGSYRGSAIKAGFSESYADRITVFMPEWISGYIRTQQIAELAEKHLTEVLMLPNITQAMGPFGPLEKTEVVREQIGVYSTGKRKGEPKFKNVKIKVPIMKPNTAVMKVKNDAAKIVLPAHDPARYGKKEGPKFSFSYNVKEVRQRYIPSTP